MDRFTGIHAVREALEAGASFDRIVIAKGRQDSRIENIVQLARQRGIAIRFEDRGQLDRLANSRDHQGVVAIAAARAAATLEDILERANHAKGQQGLIVLLDGIEDPHNLGAIIRTALAAGAHGMVIPERRAAGLTDTVGRTSAGALAHLPIAKVTNLAQTMEELKKAGYWLVGLDENGEKSYTEVDYTSPTGIVMGGEAKGLHELTRKRCDFVVSLPTSGPIKSLNVSVAAGVVLFEALIQRRSLCRRALVLRFVARSAIGPPRSLRFPCPVSEQLSTPDCSKTLSDLTRSGTGGSAHQPLDECHGCCFHAPLERLPQPSCGLAGRLRLRSRGRGGFRRRRFDRRRRCLYRMTLVVEPQNILRYVCLGRAINNRRLL